MVRSIAAVIAGYLLFALSAAALFAISGRDPHGVVDTTFMVLSIAFGVIFSFLAGFSAASIARQRRSLHGLAVAVIIAIGAIVSLVAAPGEGSLWSQISALALFAPAAALGGWAREKFSS